jgi:hypothetical protein
MFLPAPRCVATTVHADQRRPLRRVFRRSGESFDANAVDVILIVIDTGHSRNGVHALCSLEGELPLIHLGGDPLYFRHLFHRIAAPGRLWAHRGVVRNNETRLWFRNGT